MAEAEAVGLPAAAVEEGTPQKEVAAQQAGGAASPTTTATGSPCPAEDTEAHKDTSKETDRPEDEASIKRFSFTDLSTPKAGPGRERVLETRLRTVRDVLIHQNDLNAQLAKYCAESARWMADVDRVLRQNNISTNVPLPTPPSAVAGGMEKQPAVPPPEPPQPQQSKGKLEAPVPEAPPVAARRFKHPPPPQSQAQQGPRMREAQMAPALAAVLNAREFGGRRGYDGRGPHGDLAAMQYGGEHMLGRGGYIGGPVALWDVDSESEDVARGGRMWGPPMQQAPDYGYRYQMPMMQVPERRQQWQQWGPGRGGARRGRRARGGGGGALAVKPNVPKREAATSAADSAAVPEAAQKAEPDVMSPAPAEAAE